MKDKIFYACEGIIIGYVGHHIWNDVVLPIIVAAVCAVVTLLIQFYGKKFLNSLYNRKWPKWKHNGRK
jgi:H+/Cl- antiporter ClcA